MVKYIDPIVWLESKLRVCRELGLHEGEPLNILDIGTGPGHFPFVARFYGHRVIGLDFPEEVNTGKTETFLYDDLCELYGVSRIPFEIKARERLVDLNERFDLVTSFLASFNVYRDGPSLNARKLSWSKSDWQHFINDCFAIWLKPGGRIVMTLARDKIPQECWEYLASVGDNSNRERRSVAISGAAALSGPHQR